jgi:uncharacterized protein DUF4325
MEKQKEISVYELIGSEIVVSSEDGTLLFKEIVKALNENVVVTIDFGKIKIINSIFLNAAIGQLYSKYDSAKLREYLKLANIANGHLATLKKVVERAKQYFKDKDSMDDAIDKTLNE